MRLAHLLPFALVTSGCVHLNAKPMSFRCGNLLAGHVQVYQPTPLFSELQRDAGHDEEPMAPLLVAPGWAAPKATDKISENDFVVAALNRSRLRLVPQQRAHEAPATLMLSGGGFWGAFGAGYLNANGRRDWALVTGISTGALQGLFVAAGDYSRLEKEYSIDEEGDLARSNGIIGLAFKGSQYDIRPLRDKLLAYLLPPSGEQSPLMRIADTESPELLVGMVEARSGDMVIVSITQMVRSVFEQKEEPTTEQLDALAECVAGVTLASSSIPVRLTPVQIDGRTYLDGGVRSSVFDAAIAKRHEAFQKAAGRLLAPNIFVLRNGPTVVFRDAFDQKKLTFEVDARPDILRVGMRGYSAIVNQSELMSIASLRLNYPDGPIRVITADGFNSDLNPDRCGPRPEQVFPARFMRCLIRWGESKAKSGPGWIELSNIAVHR